MRNKAFRKCRLYIQQFDSSYHSTKKPDPANPHKQQLHLILDYRSLNKSINTTHNGNSLILYYPLTNITDLLARLPNCTIFSTLDLRSGYHHISLASETKLKTAFATSGKVHWNVVPFGICLLLGVFMLPYVTGFVRVRFLLCITQWHTDLQLMMEGGYSVSWGGL